MSVSVWTYRITGAERCHELLELLSDEERARYQRFKFERNRREFVCAHALLRFALSGEAGGDPAQFTFSTGEWGKPYLKDTPHWQFNISHTDGFVACAIARDLEIGIDAEKVDRNVDAAVISRRFFADEESRYIESLQADRQRDAFFRIWTLKEAFVKASGRGFDMPLREFWFELQNGEVRVNPAGNWAFWELQPEEGYRMALAALGAASRPDLHVFDGRELL